jgi:DNA-binding IclR family transcriptional regulator
MATRTNATADEMREQFSRVRWHRPISFEDFMNEANASRRDGHAIDRGMANPGLVTIAMPVTQSDEFAEMVCCASLFAGSHLPALLRTIVGELDGVRKELVKLSYGP